VDPAPCTAPPSTPRPLDPHVACAVAVPRRPSRRPPIGISAVPAPRRRRTLPCYAPYRDHSLGTQGSLPPLLAFKSRSPSPRAQGALAEPLPLPWVVTRSSTRRSRSPQTRTARASTRTSRSLPTHALPWPSPRLAGAQAPAAPAAGLRRAAHRRSSSSKTSAQVGSPQPLEPSQALPGRGRRRGRRNSSRPRRPHSPRTTLQSPRNFQGVLCNPRVDL
jgi:hypothetical protein